MCKVYLEDSFNKLWRFLLNVFECGDSWNFLFDESWDYQSKKISVTHVNKYLKDFQITIYYVYINSQNDK